MGDIESNPQNRFQDADARDMVQKLRRGVDDHLHALVFQIIDPVVINRGRDHRLGMKVLDGVMVQVFEKIMAYAPPFVYSTVSGIRSETGVEAEGWLIALGVTPEQMQAHGPEFTTKRILEAAKIAKKKGAQIMGIGLLPKAMKDTGLDVAKHAVLPITTGNSYFASSALWAGAEAVRKLGFARLKDGRLLRAKTMVIGATGAVGVICSHLLARAFEEIHLVGRNIAKLLALQEAIQKEVPAVKLNVSTRADTKVSEMDMIVATSSGARDVLDIMQVKPGVVITDTNLPSIFTKEGVAKRPDVLVIRGGGRSGCPATKWR